MSDNYWTRSRTPSPDVAMNASYWDSDSVNTVYSTGNSSNTLATGFSSGQSRSATSYYSSTGGALRLQSSKLSDNASNAARPQSNPSTDHSRVVGVSKPVSLLSSGMSASSGVRPQSKTMTSKSGIRDKPPSASSFDTSGVAKNRDPRRETQRSDQVPKLQDNETLDIESHENESSRDPRRRKRPSSSSTTLSIPCKQREVAPDRPREITRGNIDLHRLSHENSSEWALRRQFLLEHCGTVDSAMLECLSQVFINMECYGSVYPAPVMTRVREMSSHLTGDLKKVKEFTGVKFVKEAEKSHDCEKVKDKREKVKEKPLSKKPVAFVKPTTAEKVEEEAKTSMGEDATEKEETIKLEMSVEAIQARKKMYARNKLEEAMYDLSIALVLLNQEPQKLGKSRNAIESLHIAGNRTKNYFEFIHEFHGNKEGQKAYVLLDSVVVGFTTARNKRMAKHSAYQNAVEKLNKPYLRVVRVNPERQELEASDEPFKEKTQTHGFAVLGGGEVARRGMKSSQKSPQKLDKNDFILVDYSDKQENNAATMLQQSADFNKVQIKFEFEDNVDKTTTCKLFLDHEEFESFTAATNKLAKINVAEKALEKLQSTNWTMKIKGGADTSMAGLSRDEVLGEISQETESLPDTNIGSKLLKKMGWTGGGVGKDGQGIATPIKADKTLVRREGLGMSSTKGVSGDFKNKVKTVLHEYAGSDRQDDLQFSPEFSSEERAFIHSEARKLALRSKSYNQGEDRYLVVGRKRTAGQLFRHIMAQGGSTNKYELVAPHTVKTETE